MCKKDKISVHRRDLTFKVTKKRVEKNKFTKNRHRKKIQNLEIVINTITKQCRTAREHKTIVLGDYRKDNTVTSDKRKPD